MWSAVLIIGHQRKEFTIHFIPNVQTMYVHGNHDFSWYGCVDWVQLENNPGLFVATCHYMNSFLYPAKEWTYIQLYHLW